MFPADDYVQNHKKSILTLLRRVAKSLLSPKMRRQLQELRESRYVSRFPDRAMLVERILPSLSKPGSNTLWVGCRRYTRRYPSRHDRAARRRMLDTGDRSSAAALGPSRTAHRGRPAEGWCALPPRPLRPGPGQWRVRLGTRHPGWTERSDRRTRSHHEAGRHADVGLEHGSLFRSDQIACHRTILYSLALPRL